HFGINNAASHRRSDGCCLFSVWQDPGSADCHSVARQYEPFESTHASEYTTGIQQAASIGFPNQTAEGPVFIGQTRGCTIWRKIALQALDIHIRRCDGDNTKK